jgi:hypothetical protein
LPAGESRIDTKTFKNKKIRLAPVLGVIYKGSIMPVKVQVVESDDVPVMVNIRRPSWQEFLQY